LVIETSLYHDAWSEKHQIQETVCGGVEWPKGLLADARSQKEGRTWSPHKIFLLRISSNNLIFKIKILPEEVVSNKYEYSVFVVL
jgi:hypothetical protein